MPEPLGLALAAVAEKLVVVVGLRHPFEARDRPELVGQPHGVRITVEPEVRELCEEIQVVFELLEFDEHGDPFVLERFAQPVPEVALPQLPRALGQARVEDQAHGV